MRAYYCYLHRPFCEWDKLFTQKFHILSVKSEIKNFFETWNNENALLQLILGFGVFHTSHFFSTLSEHQRLGFCKWVQRVYQFASLQKPWRKGIALWPLFTNQNSLVTLRSLCTIFVQPFFSGPEVSVQNSAFKTQRVQIVLQFHKNGGVRPQKGFFTLY